MSVFSAPCGLSKAQKAQDVPANQSGLQYISASVPSSLAEGRAGALDIPLGPSLLFCLSLQLGLSPEQDVLYMLMYALGSGIFAMLRTGGLKNVVGILAGVVSMTVVSSLFARRLLSFYKRSHPSVKIEDGEPKPMFFPVQTSHTRLFPQVHSLSYPFMWTGIPIGFRGTIGGVLSCERKIEKCHPAWFTIDACDYMPRSTDHIGLDGKLREFLISQKAEPKDYPYAYLLTVAKFSGHAFNPVSFWYLYSAIRTLSAVILEVNNTFGERHSYFLDCSDTPSLTEPNASTRFTTNFSKDFFVSPFSDRSGSYSLVTNDPLYPNMSGTGPIKICLTLSSDTGKPKVVARVYSNGPPVDPAKLSWWEAQCFAMSKAWDTWATEPRTVYQAVLLTYKRGLCIFTVPEPLKTSICRKAKDHEVVIEGAFRQYLQKLVEHAKTTLRVQYTATGVPRATAEVIRRSTAQDPMATEVTELVSIRVLTPKFYARMVRYDTIEVALEQEASQGLTVEIEGLDNLLIATDDIFPILRLERGMVDKVTARLMSLLRKSPDSLTSTKNAQIDALNARNHDAHAHNKPETDARAKESFMNDLSLAINDKEGLQLYRMTVLKVLLSDWLAVGNVDLLALERFVVRAGLMYMAGNGLQSVLHRFLS